MNDNVPIYIKDMAQVTLGPGLRRGALNKGGAEAVGTAYVLFDMKPGQAEVNVVEDCQRYLQQRIDDGQIVLPPGVSYSFAGNYENQIRSQKTLMIVMPLALFIIFMILYFQFRSVLTTGIVFMGVPLAWSGGFIMLWLYSQAWFLDFHVFGTNMQTLFQIHPST